MAPPSLRRRWSPSAKRAWLSRRLVPTAPGMPRLALFGAVRPVGLGASGLPSPKNMQSGHMASFAVLALATLERNQTSIP